MNEVRIDYTEFQERPGDNLLSAISGLADELQTARERLAELEEHVKQAKENVKRLEERELPELMDEARMSSCETKSGLQVDVEEVVSAALSKGRKGEALAWLDEHGHQDLIKRSFNISFTRDEQSWARQFVGQLRRRKRPLHVEEQHVVAPATLSAWVRQQLERGEEVPHEIFGVHRFRRARVTRKK